MKKNLRRKVFNEKDEERDDQELDDIWDWKDVNNEPEIWEYSRIAGLKDEFKEKLEKLPKELDFFNLIFEDDFWNIITNETNIYAEQKLRDSSSQKLEKEIWLPIDCNEMKIYFALCIIMTQVKKATVYSNWSKREIIETPIFGKVMPCSRFLIITKYLHFSNNEKNKKQETLEKLSPIIDLFNETFKKLYVLEEDIAVDESLMKFKGRILHKVLSLQKGQDSE